MDKDELLKKWLVNELTDAERKAFESSEDFELHKRIEEGAVHFKAPDFSPEMGYTALKGRLEKKDTPVIKLFPYKILFRVAAVFLIFCSVFALYHYNSSTALETAVAEKMTFELPDASTVTLNSISKVTYSEHKWEKKRNVKLEGEAYFKVAKGSKFDVETSVGTVSVLGTQFSVKNREDYFEVDCFEGVVSVTRNGEVQKLTAGKTYKIIDNIVILDVTTKESPDWLNDFSSFEGVPLFEVLHEIERQYNVVITTQAVDTDRLFTGSFVNDDLNRALKNVIAAFDLSYKIEQSGSIIIYESE